MDKQLGSALTLAVWLLLLQGCGGGTAPDLANGALSENSSDVTSEVTSPASKGAEPSVAGARLELADISSGVQSAADFDTALEIGQTDSVSGDVADDASSETFSSAEAENEEFSSEDAGAVEVVQYKIIPDFPFAVPAYDDSIEVSQSSSATTATGSVIQPGKTGGAEDSDESTQSSDNYVANTPAISAADEETESGQVMADSTGVESITDLIFLTGQSNAASLVTKYDAALDSPDERVFAYTDQGWQIADLHQFWDEGIPGNFSADNPEREPYNNIIFQVGKALADSADRRVGIVMLTAPGEGISHWDYEGLFYSEVRERAIAALNAVPHKSSFDGLVWMQGETDWLLHGSADPDVPDFESYQSEAYLNYYPRKLKQLIESLRSDPWFGDSARFICTETIKAALNSHLMSLNSDDDSLTGCAAASDLAARENDPHGNHFSAESLRVLGQRIADVYLALQR